MPIHSDTHLCASRGGDFTLPGAGRHYPPDVDVEPVHALIELSLDLEAETATGLVTYTLRGRTESAQSLTLNAVALDISGVTDATGGDSNWVYDGQVLVVTWDIPFTPGEERKVRIAYSVKAPSGGLYFSRPTEAYPDEPLYAATDHETERARHWLPSVDQPTVRPHLDIHLTAAHDLTILATGELVSETDNGDGTKTAHWRLDYPCPSYLTCLAVGDFIRVDDRAAAGVPVAYFSHTPHTPEDLARSFGRTPGMIEWLTAKLDRPFPFPKYYQIALQGFTGAMENISLVTWNDLYVLDEILAAEFGHLVDATNIHELAHSYFGDAVVIRDYAHAWLKESWATYIETCWLEDTVSRDEADYDLFVNAHAYFDEADQSYKRPIVTREFNSSWDMYDRHLYPGGACRLHMLRRLVGDGPFWAATREYVARYDGAVVETEDFRRLMEAHSGLSLVEWFDQWIYSAGYPALKVSFAYDAAKKEGKFEIEQTQVDEKSDSRPFRLALDLAWGDTDSAERRRVVLTEAKHVVVVPMDREPSQVRVDPDAKVLAKLDFASGDARLKRQLSEAPDVIGRCLAAHELVKTRRPELIAAVAEAYPRESFWGVRAQMAKAMGAAGSQLAADVIAGWIRTESDPKVLPALMRAAAEYRDSGVLAAVEARLDGPLGYWSRHLALLALGAQRSAAPLDRLTAAADADGPTGLPQAGAFLALAASRHPEAAGLLLDKARYGATSNRARPAALRALGSLGRVRERGEMETIAEALADALRDPTPAVGRAAVAGLAALGAPEGVRSLESYRRGLPHQEQVAVDRAVASIRAAVTPPARVAEKEFDDLQDQVRKLREKLDTLAGRVNAEEGSAAATRAAPGKVPAKPAKRRAKRSKGQ